MKKILLFVFIISFTSSFAQDWAPFKTTDTIKNYVCDTTLNVLGVFNPIQTILVDTTYIDSNANTVKIFRKGFSSIRLFHRPNFSSFFSKVKVKGRIFGDTAIINNDSSIFKTRDQRGFSLVFPHHYSLDSNWVFGISSNFKLVATCDSLYQDSLNNGLDSMAQVSIQVYDSSNNLDSSHHFNTTYIISKQNGLFETIDFTGLDIAFRYQAFEWSSQTTVNENSALTVGDEFQYYMSLYGSGVPYFGTHTFNTIVIADSTANNIRYVSYLRLEQDRPPIPGNYTTPILRDTVSIQFNLNSIYSNNRSSIINLTTKGFRYPIFGRTGSNTARRIYYRYQTGNVFVYDSISSQSPANLNTIDSILLRSYFVDERLQIIGISNEFRIQNFGTSLVNEKHIFYFKKGSETWGTPLNLIVGLDEMNINEALSIFPNPTQGQITIHEIENVELIQVYNIHGQKVKEVFPLRQETVQLLLEGTPGVYFLRMQLKDGSVKTAKVVKQ